MKIMKNPVLTLLWIMGRVRLGLIRTCWIIPLHEFNRREGGFLWFEDMKRTALNLKRTFRLSRANLYWERNNQRVS